MFSSADKLLAAKVQISAILEMFNECVVDTMTKIFISYRRQDSQTMSERIHDKLVQTFGEKAVFLDVSDDIPPGANWEQVLADNLADSDVLLVVIGQQWELMLKQRLGEQDFVRFEVERGLARTGDILIIPILVNGADVPQQLPQNLTPLLGHQVMRVRQNPDFHNDMEKLVQAIKRYTQPRLNRLSAWVASVAVIIIVIAGIVIWRGNQAAPVTEAIIGATATEETVALATDEPSATHTGIATLEPTSTPTETSVPTQTSTPRPTTGTVFESNFDDATVLSAFAIEPSSDAISFEIVDGESVMAIRNTNNWFAMALNNVHAKNVTIEARIKIGAFNASFADVFFLARGGRNEYQAWVSMPHYAGFDLFDSQDTSQIDYGVIEGSFDEWHVVRFDVVDERAQIAIDGDIMAESDSLVHTLTGRIGIQQAPNVTAYWDYLWVEVLDE